MTDYAFDEKPKNDNKLKRERTGQPLSWTQVFQLVLARPGVKSFETILNDPTLSRSRAWNWIALACVICVTLTTLFLAVASSLPLGTEGLLITGGIFLVTTLAIVSVSFYLMVRLLQLSTRVLGGRTIFLDLFYAMAAINAPLMVINYSVSLVAGLSGGGTTVSANLISLFLSLYQLVLTAMAIKATARFSWRRTIMSMILFAVLVIAMFIALVGATSVH